MFSSLRMSFQEGVAAFTDEVRFTIFLCKCNQKELCIEVFVEVFKRRPLRKP